MKFIFQLYHQVRRPLRVRYLCFIIGFLLFVLLSFIGLKNRSGLIAEKSEIADGSLNKTELKALPREGSLNGQVTHTPQLEELRLKEYFLTQPSNSNTNDIWQNASFPLENFQAYTSPFGIRSSPDGSTESEFHYGLDMAAPEGSYVRNWWSGKVIEVSDNTNCGTSAVIQSGEWIHKYCHMSGYVEMIGGQQFLVDPEAGIQLQKGQLIPAGFRIGRVGMTGRTTGPHLHWIIKYGSNWVDPGLVLRAMYTAPKYRDKK